MRSVRRSRPDAVSSPPSPTPITLDAIRKYNSSNGGKGCSLLVFLTVTLTKADQAVIFDAIRDPTIQASSIAKVLNERGWQHKSGQIIRRHRRDGCDVCGIKAAV